MKVERLNQADEESFETEIRILPDGALVLPHWHGLATMPFGAGGGELV